MTKLYITEFTGTAATAQGDGIDVMSEPALRTSVIDTTATTGPIAVLGAITAGSLYTNGVYPGVPLTGGTGSGAVATITVAGAAVTAVTLTNAGTGYTAADSLSASAANIGGTGSGFAIAVTSINHSLTLLANTRFIELAGDGICSFVLGQVNGNAGPVATTSNARLPANNQPIRRGIAPPTGAAPGTPWTLSAITNT